MEIANITSYVIQVSLTLFYVFIFKNFNKSVFYICLVLWPYKINKKIKVKYDVESYLIRLLFFNFFSGERSQPLTFSTSPKYLFCVFSISVFM
jgi:hypothetical protein